MPLTGAERARIYREKKRQQLRDKSIRPPPKSGAQRARECRARKKALLAAIQRSNNIELQQNNINDDETEMSESNVIFFSEISEEKVQYMSQEGILKQINVHSEQQLASSSHYLNPSDENFINIKQEIPEIFTDGVNESGNYYTDDDTFSETEVLKIEPQLKEEKIEQLDEQKEHFVYDKSSHTSILPSLNSASTPIDFLKNKSLAVSTIVKMQLRENKPKKWTKLEMHFSETLYCKSPKMYEFMLYDWGFSLPSIGTMKFWLRNRKKKRCLD